MLTWQFELLVFAAAFILGALEGHNLWAWLKSWFVKEVKIVETKITGATGPH